MRPWLGASDHEAFADVGLDLWVRDRDKAQCLNRGGILGFASCHLVMGSPAMTLQSILLSAAQNDILRQQCLTSHLHHQPPVGADPQKINGATQLRAGCGTTATAAPVITNPLARIMLLLSADR
ncbi:hypothetical protein E4U56_003923 [Claviceps arundinis]|uniref:Uncharacterized protein n=1 Tax=Claviceps arundinis TaxID=1623583 RepID=A0A9P7SMU8_9HYPO|nr:hypothetical protein E4U56_003923 [Claviceps arundinis]